MAAAMAPLRVQFELATAWVQPSSPLHLDGIIAYAVVEEQRHRGTFTDFEASLRDLPLAREERLGQWCWKASHVQPTAQLGLSQRYLTRKFWSEGYVDEYAKKRIALGPRPAPGAAPPEDPAQGFDGVIDTTSKHLKNAAFLYPVALVPGAVAYCIGDGERIEYLLRTYLTHLGKRGRLDHGRIRRITVAADPQAEQLWWRRDLPWPRAGFVEAEGRVHPPYWSRRQMVRLFVPADCA
jgi:CRISPR type IV-associated protein Csf3